jgi:hypothetical protein
MYMEQATKTVSPKLIFIVPYRDREQHRLFFASHMEKIMEDYSPGDYEIYYSHQKDKREFNRGAVKNIGFLAMKQKYPDDYKDITFVFNDVDTMPYTKNFLDYDTQHGTVKHFYGFKFTLGGIFSIKGGDFEKVNGFPNFWSWGYEDNSINRRVRAKNIYIDRSNFYPLWDKNILSLQDGLTRTVNRGEYERYMDHTNEGLNSIRDIAYEISGNFIDIHNFDTGTVEDPKSKSAFDLRQGNIPFPDYTKPTPTQIAKVLHMSNTTTPAPGIEVRPTGPRNQVGGIRPFQQMGPQPKRTNLMKMIAKK